MPVTNAALLWINNINDSNYELTSVVDYDAALKALPGESYEIGLILCDGEICTREQVRVVEHDGEFKFKRVEKAHDAIPP